MPKKTTPKPAKKVAPKAVKAAKETAPATPEAHAATPAHNHGPTPPKAPAFGFNRGGGAKPPRPPMPRMIVRGANRGR